MWFALQAGEGVEGSRVFVVGGMSQLADYVYRDYHARIQALNSRVQHTEVRTGHVHTPSSATPSNLDP